MQFSQCTYKEELPRLSAAINLKYVNEELNTREFMKS